MTYKAVLQLNCEEFVGTTRYCENLTLFQEFIYCGATPSCSHSIMCLTPSSFMHVSVYPRAFGNQQQASDRA